MSARVEGESTAKEKAHYDVSIIGIVGLPAQYGGFETLTEQITDRLQTRLRMQVFCTVRGRTDGFPARYRNVDLRYVSWDANGWQSVLYDFVSLWQAARTTKTVLLLGVSGCLFLPFIRLRSPSTRIVVNIDGLEWRRQKWGRIARWLLRVSEWCAVRFSDTVIADNEAIKNHVLNQYGVSAVLIAYGGDHCISAYGSIPSSDTRFAPGHYFLAVCRIEPENNIKTILRAFADAPDQNIVVVGNWHSSQYAQNLRSAFTGFTNIEFKDAIYDQVRLASLRAGAIAYVHGHSAGGTNPSLVEAMSFGMAVLAYDVVYNRYTTGNNACYWETSGDLSKLIACVTDDELRRNACSMKALASRCYIWDKISDEYARVIGEAGL